MEPKFKAGDYVTIRHGIDKIRFSNDPGLNSDMLEMQGKTYKVSYVSDYTHIELIHYQLENVQWTWIEQWLEPAEGFTEDFKDIMETNLMNMF